jgi:hypothetical protein
MQNAPCDGQKPHEFILIGNEIAKNNKELV